MKFALTLGVAIAAVTLTASAANTHYSRTVIRHGGPSVNFDTDNDGWLTRAEAAAGADQVFDQLDTNDDGSLTSDDRQHVEDIDIDVDIDVPDVRIHRLELDGGEDGERHVRIIRGEDIDEEEIEREVERAMERAERQVERAERQVREAERQADRAQRQAERQARHAERMARAHARAAAYTGSRDVIIIRSDTDDVIAPIAPLPPIPPRPPMFMMLIANSDEADLNGDGSLTREEFRAQHLRFFDASDANGDGRVRFERPPEPPAPPVAPTPPTPPEPPRNR